MSPFTELRESDTRRLGIGRVHWRRQKLSETDSIELRPLRSTSSRFEKDTSYHSQYDSDNGHIGTSTSEDHVQRARRWKSGWRFGAISCAISASIVFLINFFVTVWGSVHSKANGNVLYEGDCDRVDRLNRMLHLLINILSTILLSSSNYCMQCLSAPTRKEVDEAHARRVWLDIGVPSIHNLSRISIKRVILWFLLGLSSLPLHLFYNSAVFSSIAANDYFALSVSESFIKDPECFNCDSVKGPWSMKSAPVRRMWEKARDNTLDNLTNIECIEQYAVMLQSKRRNVLLVGSDDKFPPANESGSGGSRVYAIDYVSANNAALPEHAPYMFNWICSMPNNFDSYGRERCLDKLDDVKSASDSWTVLFPVDYCLSERTGHCKLQYMPSITILVTVLNLFKAVLIFYTAFGIAEEPLMTMGDAVASFLKKEDLTTKGMCLLSMREVKKSRHYFSVGARSGRQIGVGGKTFAVIITIVGFLYGKALNGLREPMGLQGSPSLAAQVGLGFGAIDPRAIIQYDISTTLGNIFVANSPQPILSFLYFSYNGLFTGMLLGQEWSTYANHRKGLRVSRNPAGSQRSTYFLQLPYRFAFPLMALSGVLHWLVSQSIFLVSIVVYDSDGNPGSGFGGLADWSSCGYSPIAMFTVIILGCLMIAVIISFGFVPFKKGMNLAGSCSVAISAACHLAEDHVDGYTAAVSKLQWGVVGMDDEGVGHCAFSTKEVEQPKKGEMYAG
ncbi:hypothetical protein K458DRAFT_390412 [Lentithecium fluviatile CBS 122367]|uniref:DUF6536 domain-containing protein n=1 Tax=Lentithecium fluviatile CBS 122367 TaxID=1168545 RepID=A0A6G1IYX5_9PLEO|nr:hypothetical protein K458DRAFT_390412 [Lentithecium fluviatile CBS 122367]